MAAACSVRRQSQFKHQSPDLRINKHRGLTARLAPSNFRCDRPAPPLHSAQFAAPFRQPSFVTPQQLNGTTKAPFQFSEPKSRFRHAGLAHPPSSCFIIDVKSETNRHPQFLNSGNGGLIN